MLKIKDILKEDFEKVDLLTHEYSIGDKQEISFDEPYIYHITPVNNLSSIQSNGLEPKKILSMQNELRIYFTTHKKMVVRMCFHLRKALILRKIIKYNDKSNWALLTIDGNIKDIVKFYQDPESPSSIYCTQTIPKEYIKKVDIISGESLLTKNIRKTLDAIDVEDI